MFYLYLGHVNVTPAGQAVKEYTDVRADFVKERDFAHVITYIFYVYTKKDNPYWGLPPRERKVQVVSAYGLFDDLYKNGVKLSWESIEMYSSVRKLIDFYLKIQLTDNELNHEAFRAKAEYWRNKLMQMENSPEDEESYAKALATATKLAEEFKVKAELEHGEDEGDGTALYLFEIPEDKKPYHARMKL